MHVNVYNLGHPAPSKPHDAFFFFQDKMGFSPSFGLAHICIHLEALCWRMYCPRVARGGGRRLPVLLNRAQEICPTSHDFMKEEPSSPLAGIPHAPAWENLKK